MLCSVFHCFWSPLLCDNFLIFKLRLSFNDCFVSGRRLVTHKDLVVFLCIKFSQSLAFHCSVDSGTFESLCRVGFSGLSSAVGLDKLKRRQVLMINLIISRLEICDSQTPCYLFSPLFHRWFFSQVASLFLLPLPLPPSRPALLLRCFEGRKFAVSAPAAERESEQVRSSTPLHHFLSSLFLSSASRPDSSWVFSFSIILTVVTAMDLRTSLAVSLVLLLLVVPTHASKWTFWSRTLELLFW